MTCIDRNISTHHTHSCCNYWHYDFSYLVRFFLFFHIMTCHIVCLWHEFFMCSLGTWIWETCVAILTLIWFHFGVNSFMSCLISCVWETLVAILACGFSLVQSLSCVVFALGCEKLLLQYWHWYGFSLVWFFSLMSCLCTFIWETLFEILAWQLNGFSFVWIHQCVVLSLDSVKPLFQYWHWYGFSLVWILSCLVFVPLSEKIF